MAGRHGGRNWLTFTAASRGEHGTTGIYCGNRRQRHRPRNRRPGPGSGPGGGGQRGGAPVRRAGRGDGGGGPGGAGCRRRQPGDLARGGPAPGQPLPHLYHRHQPGACPECAHRPQRRRPHRGGWELRHHLRGGHRPETGQTGDRPEVTWDLAGLQRAASPGEAVALAWEAVKR